MVVDLLLLDLCRDKQKQGARNSAKAREREDDVNGIYRRKTPMLPKIAMESASINSDFLLLVRTIVFHPSNAELSDCSNHTLPYLHVRFKAGGAATGEREAEYLPRRAAAKKVCRRPIFLFRIREQYGMI